MELPSTVILQIYLQYAHARLVALRMRMAPVSRARARAGARDYDYDASQLATLRKGEKLADEGY